MRRGVRSALSALGVLLLFAAMWEGYRLFATSFGNVWPGTVVALPIEVRGTGNAQEFPHLWDIFGAFSRPYRSGDVTLGSYLLANVAYTAREVAVGFALGVALGFALGVAFAHSKLLERAFMPYVVASQTVPFVAFAPLFVIAVGTIDWAPSWLGVSLLSTYLVFFSMTVNTLRGMRAAEPTAEQLMRAYATTSWQRLIRLRLPAAVPHLFIGMKIGAAAAVLGAIAGEVSAPNPDGLGKVLFNFGRVSNNSLQLFATTIVVGLLGIAAYLVVRISEVIVMRRFYGRTTDGAR